MGNLDTINSKSQVTNTINSNCIFFLDMIKILRELSYLHDIYLANMRPGKGIKLLGQG